MPDNQTLTPENSPTPLGDMITTLHAIREERKDLAARDKTLSKQYAELEQQVLSALDEQQTTLSRAHGITVSVTEAVHPQIDDYEAFCRYIIDNEALYLLQRRISSAPYRDLLASGTDVPGLSPFTKRSLSLRSS